MHIDATVTEEDGFKWRLTGIYGESKMEKKVETWRLLRTLHMQEKLPWICLGDFNEILYNYEKQGGVPRNQVYMNIFCDALDFCELKDLGFEGDIFTWRNNNFRVDGYIRERLDRAVASPAWCARFPGYKVTNGHPQKSDHRPIILDVDGGRTRYVKPTGGDPIKKFKARWLLEEDYEVRVEKAWQNAQASGATKLQDILRGVSTELHDWSRNILGDLAKRIKKLKVELEKCRMMAITAESVRQEQVLRFKFERLEEQQDLMWRQRAHVNWLEKGDRNTDFFHSYASERKKTNTITKLKKDDGGVVEGEEGLKALVSNYFTSLFTP